MSAYLEVRKGPVKPVVHEHPDLCDRAKALINPIGLSGLTAWTGKAVGWWTDCAECARITDTLAARAST